MARLGLLLVAAAVTGLTAGSQSGDATRVLADMRQALGGDAIAGVRAFSVETTEQHYVRDQALSIDVEWVCVLPDRFIQVRQLKSHAGDLTMTMGFKGDEVIQWFDGTVLGRRPPIQPAGRTTAAPPASLRASLIGARQLFSRLVIGMLGITAVYPLEAAYVSQETLDGKPVHVVELTAVDGYQSRLYVDTATHLPRMINWMGRAPGPLDRIVPSADPAAGLPLVERRIFFSEYKSTGGLNWPHRLKEVVARQTVTDIRLGKFKINPEIDPKRFDASR